MLRLVPVQLVARTLEILFMSVVNVCGLPSEGENVLGPVSHAGLIFPSLVTCVGVKVLNHSYVLVIATLWNDQKV